MRVISDYKCQISAIEGMREVMGDAFQDPREYKGIADQQTGKFISTKKLSQKAVPKGPYTIPYLLYAYDVSRTTFQRKRHEDSVGGVQLKTDKRTLRKNQTVIENRGLAASKYNARFFFATEGATRSWAVPDGTGDAYRERYSYWGKQYDKRSADGEEFPRYEQMAREHDEQHPFIKPELISALEANVCRSYRALSVVCPRYAPTPPLHPTTSNGPCQYTPTV